MSPQQQKAAQTKAAQQRSGVLLFFTILFSLIALPLIILSFKILRKPIDATTHPKIKEVHDRNALGLVVTLLLYVSFLLIAYSISIFQQWSLLKAPFYFLSLCFSFILMVIGARSFQNIKSAGRDKEDGYKQYLVAIAVVIAFSVINFVAIFVWILSSSKKTPLTQKK